MGQLPSEDLGWRSTMECKIKELIFDSEVGAGESKSKGAAGGKYSSVVGKIKEMEARREERRKKIEEKWEEKKTFQE